MSTGEVVIFSADDMRPYRHVRRGDVAHELVELVVPDVDVLRVGAFVCRPLQANDKHVFAAVAQLHNVFGHLARVRNMRTGANFLAHDVRVFWSGTHSPIPSVCARVKCQHVRRHLVQFLVARGEKLVAPQKRAFTQREFTVIQIAISLKTLGLLALMRYSSA